VPPIPPLLPHNACTSRCIRHLGARNSNSSSPTNSPTTFFCKMVKEETAALTGQILQTDASASDIMLPVKDSSSSSSSGWRSKRFLLEAGTVLLLLALLGTVVGLAVGLSRSNQNRGLDPACIHALGGGPVKSGKHTAQPVTGSSSAMLLHKPSTCTHTSDSHNSNNTHPYSSTCCPPPLHCRRQLRLLQCWP
jgi:hypothetical protein